MLSGPIANVGFSMMSDTDCIGCIDLALAPVLQGKVGRLVNMEAKKGD